MPRSLLAVLVLTTAVACAASNPASSSVPAGREFQVRPGESVAVQGTDLALRFERVAQDSRCPADAVCVTLGDAVSVFSVTRGGQPADSLSLHTEPGAGQQGTIGDWTLSLTRLEPYPYASRPIEPSDYRATLRVDRAAS
jgi:hypothetical protein